MSEKYTKGEYQLSGQAHQPHSADYFSIGIRAEKSMSSHFVASVKGYTDENCIANAEHIVECVNNHEILQNENSKLREALIAAKELIGHYRLKEVVPTQEVWEQIEIALTK